MWEYNQNELYHYGVRGMRWGVRRTRRQINRVESRRASSSGSSRKEAKKNQARNRFDRMFDPELKGGKDKPNISRTEKVGKESEKIIDNSTSLTRSISRMKNRNVESPAKKMTNDELNLAIKRMDLEKRYNSLASESNTSKGMDYAMDILAIAGSVAAIGASTAAIISTVKK